MTGEKIVEIAIKYLGQAEVSGNKGWNDKSFEAQMRAVGWQPSHSWCCYFTELVAKEAAGKGTPAWAAFDKLFQPSCTATYANFSGSSLYKVGKIPKPGSLIVWKYAQTWKGHIGIVESVKGDVISTIEGNTNKAGSREGTHVLRKTRRLVWTNGSGLNLIGFIYLA